jgi:hypothetical protein
MAAKKKTVSDRSKKAEILEAYEELKEELKELRKTPKPEPRAGSRPQPPDEAEAVTPKRTAVLPEQEEAVFTPEGLIKGIS